MPNPYIKIDIEKDGKGDVDVYWPKVKNDEDVVKMAQDFTGLIVMAVSKNIMPAVRHAVSVYGHSSGMPNVARAIHSLLDSVLESMKENSGPLIPPSEALKKS